MHTIFEYHIPGILWIYILHDIFRDVPIIRLGVILAADMLFLLY